VVTFYILQGCDKAGRQIPTFYLNANIQGILGAAGAERIAEDMFPGGHFYAAAVYYGEYDTLPL
jgi:hypothetical protein